MLVYTGVRWVRSLSTWLEVGEALAASLATAHQPESPRCGKDPGLLLPGWSSVVIPRGKGYRADHVLSIRLALDVPWVAGQ